MNIKLAFSVRGISKTACMHLSACIQNGIAFTGCNNNEIVVHRNRIEFGRSILSDALDYNGYIIPNMLLKNGFVTYTFGSNMSCSLSGVIEYVGDFPPTEPDNSSVYNELIRKFEV